MLDTKEEIKRESPYKGKKKEFLAETDKKQPSLYKVRVEGGGQVPKVLSGRYTSQAEALKDVALYEHLLDKRSS